MYVKHCVYHTNELQNSFRLNDTVGLNFVACNQQKNRESRNFVLFLFDKLAECVLVLLIYRKESINFLRFSIHQIKSQQCYLCMCIQCCWIIIHNWLLWTDQFHVIRVVTSIIHTIASSGKGKPTEKVGKSWPIRKFNRNKSLYLGHLQSFLCAVQCSAPLCIDSVFQKYCAPLHHLFNKKFQIHRSIINIIFSMTLNGRKWYDYHKIKYTHSIVWWNVT